jgi:hypothetical protein
VDGVKGAYLCSPLTLKGGDREEEKWGCWVEESGKKKGSVAPQKYFSSKCWRVKNFGLHLHSLYGKRLERNDFRVQVNRKKGKKIDGIKMIIHQAEATSQGGGVKHESSLNGCKN